MTGLRHAWQTWNNCGPATLATYLSYFGSGLDQGVIGAALRTHDDDKNVLPEELAAYAQSQGYHAHIFVNGSSKLMRLLPNWLYDRLFTRAPRKPRGLPL